MKFWDSSALIPLIVPEPETRALGALLKSDPAVAAWWGSRAECAAALARLERERRITGQHMAQARSRLEHLADQWIEVSPSAQVREQAERLLRVHALRSADAHQLAAAMVASRHRPASLEFVTIDQRLADAARREGFRLLPN
jgi:predicted nucleic acid-binding protein